MKNKVITVARVATGLICWFLIYKLYGAFVDPLLEGVLPEIARMVLMAMVVPYTLGLGAFLLVTIGMPRSDYAVNASLKPGIGTIAKYFVIQTGLSFPVMVALNAALTIAGVESRATSPEQIMAHPVFFFVLLIIFNPIFEELLFRKFVLERIGVLGTKGAIICSAVFFALPHVYSQGIPQMFFTFTIGLVYAYLTLKTGKLWPAVILHALSNIYCAYIPMGTALIHPALSVVFILVTLSVMIPLTIIFIKKEVRSNMMPSNNLREEK